MRNLIAEALVRHRGSIASLWWRRCLLLTNLTPPLLLWATGGTQLWAWIYAAIVHHTLLAGLFLPNNRALGPVLRKLPTGENTVWLTIDDGPSSDTVAIAEMLGALNVTATFFFQGNRIASQPDIGPVLQRHGHTVANHTQSHDLAWFWLASPSRVRREVDAFEVAAAQANLPIIPAFRCPAGIKNPFLHGVLFQRKLTLVGWSARAHDGIRCERVRNLRNVLSCLRPGVILLVHEGKQNAFGEPASVEFIRELVRAVQARGYRFADARSGS